MANRLPSDRIIYKNKDEKNGRYARTTTLDKIRESQLMRVLLMLTLYDALVIANETAAKKKPVKQAR